MPTFKNETARTIYCIVGHLHLQFSPGETRELPFWVPYKRKGLTLIDGAYPPVPDTILVSGTFDFAPGMERDFYIEPCGHYEAQVIVESGAAKVYTGNAATPVVLDTATASKYLDHLEWELAPYLRIVCDNAARVTVHCEVCREPGRDMALNVRNLIREN